MKHEDWYGCYAGGWQAAPLVPEAYAHPAKVSFTLADRIYRHMLAGGWLEPGDVVVDPFGGVGGFAFHAALYGMHWQGVELEQKFVDLGNQNLDLWRDRYAPHFPNYGTASLVQGDSRRLVDVVTGAGGVVSSPPYAESVKGDMGSSWAEDDKRKPTSEHARTYSDMRLGKSAMGDYGSTPGQLGAMPAGAVVTSPPYADALSTQDHGIVDDRRRRNHNDAQPSHYQLNMSSESLPTKFPLISTRRMERLERIKRSDSETLIESYFSPFLKSKF